MVKKREPVGFVVNPNSGSKNKAKIPDIIKGALDTMRFKPIIVYSSAPGHARELAKDFVDNGLSKVIAVGGDGTVNEVASSLLGTKATLGIVPIGSGNGLARHLRIPMNPERATRVINHGRIFMADYGTINGTPFFCTSGVGFDAHVGNLFAQMGSRGFSTYLKVILKEYLSYRPQKYTLNFDSFSMEREAFLITVANSSQWGNNARIAPSADIADGLLDVVILSPFPWFAAPSLGLSLFRRKIGRSRFVETFRVKTLTLERESEDFIHFDGEPGTLGRQIDFGIEHLGVNIFIP